MTAASELVAYCGGTLCKDGMEGRCPGHPKADHEFTPDLIPMDPAGPVVATMDELTTSARMILETVLRRAMSLDATCAILRAENTSMRETLGRIATGFERHTARELGEWAVTELEK